MTIKKDQLGFISDPDFPKFSEEEKKEMMQCIQFINLHQRKSFKDLKRMSYYKDFLEKIDYYKDFIESVLNVRMRHDILKINIDAFIKISSSYKMIPNKDMYALAVFDALKDCCGLYINKVLRKMAMVGTFATPPAEIKKEVNLLCKDKFNALMKINSLVQERKEINE